MANIIIPASKSLTVTNKFPKGNINTDKISIGYDGEYHYSSYLFFDTSLIPNNTSIYSAELVLFKTCDFYNDRTITFKVYPLLDFFSTYTTYNNCPAVCTSLKSNFFPFTKKTAIEINVTQIVCYWQEMSLKNKGLILTGSYKKISYTSFGSALSKDSYIIPILYISYYQEGNQELPKPDVSYRVNIKQL